jgi:hypothetical protein
VSLSSFATGRTDARVQHDWTTVQEVHPGESCRSLDLAVVGVSRARSENKFKRVIGEKENRMCPPFIEKAVLLCEHAATGKPVKLYVDGAGLVPGIIRALPELGIKWPEPAAKAFDDDNRPAPVMCDSALLFSVEFTGVKDAAVGQFSAFTVTRIQARDPAKFLAEYRERHQENVKETAHDAPAETDPIPF